MRYFAGTYDVAVIGAGHAGIEAALVAARLGLRTVLFTINLDAVGNMPCNPAIGGTGKGHLVRELDALGGEMGKAADACCIQYRMLNRGKGPAVHSLRAQADRRRYQEHMKQLLEREPRLELKQATVTELLTENGALSGVVTQLGAEYRVKACVVAAGTYLDSRVIIGDCSIASGPDGMRPAPELTKSLAALGLRLRRFKTGTPPRINARSVDFSRMELQPGDDDPEPFSLSTGTPPKNQAVCWLTYTNEKTHAIIRANLDRSPIYDGSITGVGPRYCPSIETKVVRFAEKKRHQLFLEPCGLHTDEMYLQGFSSSLPEDVQLAMLHTVLGREPMILRRSDGYIGTLIDDLVTKGTEEPYRIMTSRSEYRLLHRQDNADERLAPIGHRIGLLSDAQLAAVEEKYRLVRAEMNRLEHSGVAASDALNAFLRERGSSPVVSAARLADLLRRPELTYADLAPFDRDRPALPKAVTDQVEIRIKYAGYLARQEKQIEEFAREESRLLPPDADYDGIHGLRLEARQKLSAIRPHSIGQAGRISGVSPADIAVLLIWLENRK